MELTISQALRRISKLKGTLKEELSRAATAVVYDENTPPAFLFPASMERATVVRDEMIKLESALRVTNAKTMIEHTGKKITLAEATCLLQETKGMIAWLRALPCQAQSERKTESTQRNPYTQEITKTVQVVKCDLTEVKRAELVQREQDLFDVLNDAVESVNHRTVLG